MKKIGMGYLVYGCCIVLVSACASKKTTEKVAEVKSPAATEKQVDTDITKKVVFEGLKGKQKAEADLKENNEKLSVVLDAKNFKKGTYSVYIEESCAGYKSNYTKKNIAKYNANKIGSMKVDAPDVSSEFSTNAFSLNLKKPNMKKAGAVLIYKEKPSEQAVSCNEISLN